MNEPAPQATPRPAIGGPVIPGPAIPGPATIPSTPPPRQRRHVLWLGVIAFFVLAGAIGSLWFRVLTQPDAPDIGVLLVAIDARLARLEQQPRPSVPGPDLTPRVVALEQRAPPDLTALQTRVVNLERRPPNDTEAMAARVTALEQMLGHADRLTHVQAAAAALAAGRPLGEIPGAPPALVRFAQAAPPTEAALRLAFPATARAVLNASRPDDDGKPLWSRLLGRMTAPFTVRQGDHVLVGDPASGVLARARTALDAGDMSGTIAALADLRGPAAAAMAGWLANATALRDARTALADMAAQP